MALSAQQPAFDIQPLLRPSERVTVNLPCRVRTEQLSYTVAEVAVVLSRTPGFEEAAWVWSSSALNMILIFISIFVVLPPSAPSDVRLIHRIPVTSTFKHTLNQTPPSPNPSLLHQSSRPRQSILYLVSVLISWMIRHHPHSPQQGSQSRPSHFLFPNHSRTVLHHRVPTADGCRP
jgi:hypothetical protein